MSKILTNYEQEFEPEVEQEQISVSDLLSAGIKKDVLALECYLRDCYGDEIFKSDINEGSEKVEGSKKRIQKLSGVEINKNEEFKTTLEDFEKPIFDTQVNRILMLIREREE